MKTILVCLIAILFSVYLAFTIGYKAGYNTGCDYTIERLLPGDQIPCEPWGEEK